MKIFKLVTALVFILVGIGYSILSYVSRYVDFYLSRLGNHENQIQVLEAADHLKVFLPSILGITLAIVGFFIFRNALKS